MRSSFTHPLLLVILLLLLSCKAFTQDSSSIFNRIISFPDKVFNRIDKEANSFEHKLNSQTEKYLSKLQRQEEKLKRKLWKQDSTKAKEVFGDVKGRYDQLRISLKQKEGQVQSSVYNGHLDSLTTAMKFLQSNPLLKEGDALSQKVAGNIMSIASLKSCFNQTEYIRKQIQERQQQLKQQLQNTGLAKEFRKYRKEVYYYQQQVREYKEALEDPRKLGPKLLETAMKFPAFKEFFRKNSQLASLFRIPGGTDPGNLQSFAGLQTRADVQSILQQRIGSGPSAQEYIQQQMQTAQSEIQKLKNKVNQFGGGSSELEMPDFKTNSQKTKSFLKRIEWGSNMQTSKGNLYFPVTSDIGLSAGFKLNDKSIIGIGASYKIGFGQNWENIKISHQGIGVRSFIDWKIKGSFWISGGYEHNYKAEFSNFNELRNYSAWQQSGLIGVSKVVSLKTKFFKKTKLQLLWDFLSYQQVPRTQAILFRIGYSIK